jgi:hypothetical protein
VRDECLKRGLLIGRQPINFVLRGIAFSGHRFGSTIEVATTLAEAFCRNAFNLCLRNQLYLNPGEEHLVSTWLVGHELTNDGDEHSDEVKTESFRVENAP